MTRNTRIKKLVVKNAVGQVNPVEVDGYIKLQEVHLSHLKPDTPVHREISGHLLTANGIKEAIAERKRNLDELAKVTVDDERRVRRFF